MFQFIPQHVKPEKRSGSDNGDKRVTGEAPPSYEDALEISSDIEEVIQQKQADNSQRQDMNIANDQQNKVKRHQRRRRRRSASQKPIICPSFLWEFPLLITYYVGYYKDDAADNLRKHEAASECTYFPDLFVAWFIIYHAHCFCVVLVLCTKKTENCLCMCVYWTVYLGQIILELIMLIHFFNIDDDCQEVIKTVGSDLFWNCMQINSYYFLLLCSSLVFWCCCCCCCCCNMSTTTQSNNNRRRTHRSVQMESNNDNASSASGGVYSFGGNQSVQMNLTNSTLTLSGNCKFFGSASDGNISMSGNSSFIGNIQNSTISLSGNSSVNGMVHGCMITASGNSSCQIASESCKVVTSGNARVVTSNAHHV